jgi:hypothetical protein
MSDGNGMCVGGWVGGWVGGCGWVGVYMYIYIRYIRNVNIYREENIYIEENQASVMSDGNGRLRTAMLHMQVSSSSSTLAETRHTIHHRHAHH